MKATKVRIIGLFIIFGFILNSAFVYSQDVKLSRREKKEVRRTQLELNYYIIDSLLSARSFVLEADYLRNNYGEKVLVLTNLNFIKADKTNGVLQTGSNSGLGYNGVGGVTAEGTIGIYKISKDLKNLKLTLIFSLLTNLGNYDIVMMVNAANNATATITGMGPGKLTWDGHLKTVNNSGVFKGTTTY